MTDSTLPIEGTAVSPSRPRLVLGLDPGIASCGFCLLDETNNKILEMGVHLFDAPQNPKTKVSNAVARRGARSARRNIKRTRDRLTHALRLLKDEGIVPSDAEKDWFQPRKGEKPVLKLRAAGLDRQLSDREWAQVLYSLCVRRGYIPHGEGDVEQMDKSSDDGKVLTAVKENAQRLEAGGFRTVGEMMARHGKSRNHGGAYDLCVTNAQIIDEVNQLFQAQRDFGGVHASESFQEDYIACLTWQKDCKDYDERVYALVGPCSYFPDLKRAADADLTSQMLRAQERLAHITLIDPTGREGTLPFEVRKQLMSILFSPVTLPKNKDCKVTYSTIRKIVDPSGKTVFKGIDHGDEKTKEPFEPRAWRAYRKAGVSSELLRRMLDDLELADAIGEAMTYASTPTSLLDRLDELELSDDEIAQLAKVPFASKVFKGYGSRSLFAQSMLLDAFDDEDIHTLVEAEEATGLLQKRLTDSGERFELLPPFTSFDPTCRNPVVLRAMSRMRKIVNAIIKVHGIPDVVRIELGRDLKQSEAQKSKAIKIRNDNEKNNRRIAGKIAELLECSPEEVAGSQIRKYSLWEEQGNKDAYTGERIDVQRLVSEPSYTQIDHILPYSRTCDDSRANKVLVLAKSNQDKRERSPYEWMTSGEPGAPDWDVFCAHVQSETKIPFRKRQHLLERDLAGKQGDFIERNLNDDRYMSVAVKDYLAKMLAFPQDGHCHVFAVAGGATSILRRSWGLNFGDGNSKDRSDDRHHAVDAAVIAACDPSLVIKLAHASEQRRKVPKEERDTLFAGTQPWSTFTDDVRAAREIIIPTRMADHGVTGQAFEETLYRFGGMNEKGKGVLCRRSGDKPSGNFVVNEDGSARIVGELAFLRLWFDPTKAKGQWYGEPVYCADIPAIVDGTYIPRYMKAHSSRLKWPEVPESARCNPPLMVFPDDVVVVGDQSARFRTVNIDNAGWEMKDLPCGEPKKGWPTVGKLNAGLWPTVLNEDILGHCYYRLSE